MSAVVIITTLTGSLATRSPAVRLVGLNGWLAVLGRLAGELIADWLTGWGATLGCSYFGRPSGTCAWLQ